MNWHYRYISDDRRKRCTYFCLNGPLQQIKPRLNTVALSLYFCELHTKCRVQTYEKMSLNEGSGIACWQGRCFAGEPAVTSAWWGGLFLLLKWKEKCIDQLVCLNRIFLGKHIRVTLGKYLSATRRFLPFPSLHVIGCFFDGCSVLLSCTCSQEGVSTSHKNFVKT